jgi:hypothetical protein
MKDKKTAADAVKKFISVFYKDMGIEEISVAHGMYNLPYIIVWYNQEDPNVANDNRVFRETIIKDVNDYLGYKLSPDPPSTMGTPPFMLKKYENSDFYIDVRSNNVAY